MYWDQRSPEVFATLYTNMEILSELSSVKITWNQSEDRNSTADSILYYVQEEIEKGTDGILICPPNDQVLPMICRMCEEATFTGAFISEALWMKISGQSVKPPLLHRKCLRGWEETNAYLLTKKMLEQGYRKIALLSEAKWDTTCTAREKGINRALEETDGAEIVVEARDIRSEEDAAAMTRSILDAYPEVDCVYLAGSTIRKAPEIILDTILEERKDGSVGLVTIDFSQSLTEDFESGVLKAAFGVPQFSIDAYYMAVSMINTLKGFPLSEDAESYCVPGFWWSRKNRRRKSRMPRKIRTICFLRKRKWKRCSSNGTILLLTQKNSKGSLKKIYRCSSSCEPGGWRGSVRIIAAPNPGSL